MHPVNYRVELEDTLEYLKILPDDKGMRAGWTRKQRAIFAVSRAIHYLKCLEKQLAEKEKNA